MAELFTTWNNKDNISFLQVHFQYESFIINVMNCCRDSKVPNCKRFESKLTFLPTILKTPWFWKGISKKKRRKNSHINSHFDTRTHSLLIIFNQHCSSAIIFVKVQWKTYCVQRIVNGVDIAGDTGWHKKIHSYTYFSFLTQYVNNINWFECLMVFKKLATDKYWGYIIQEAELNN